jgi:hypothetical protein
LDRSGRATETTFGRLDVREQRRDIDEGGAVDEDLEAWHQVIAVNQTGMFLGMKHAVPAMRRAGGGSIVNVSSTLGVVGADFTCYRRQGAVRQMTDRPPCPTSGRHQSGIWGFVGPPMTDELEDEIRDHDIGMTPMACGQNRSVSYAVLLRRMSHRS